MSSWIDKAMEGASNRVTARINEQRAHLAKFEIWANEQKRVMRRALEDYATYGSALCDDAVRHAVEHFYTGSERDLFKEAQVALKRNHLLFAATSGFGNIDLSVPKNTKLENVVAGLLLLAQPAEFAELPKWPRQRFESAPPHDVCLDETPQRWRFLFRSGEGVERYNEWRELCRTCPVNRIILKITT